MSDRVLTIIGTRPEAIKLAPVVTELRSRGVDAPVCITGQHREMVDQALDAFDLTPDLNLGIMAANQTLSSVTALAMRGLDQVLSELRPKVVIVQGDTNTTLCGSLAAYYHRIPVAHVEAGLRTGDKYAPFPEEMNRRISTQIADVHFAHTARARDALLREGVAGDAIHVTGNTVIDALLLTRRRVAREHPSVPATLSGALDGRPVVLITAHRRESFGGALHDICAAIRDAAAAARDAVFVFPVHPNPNVHATVAETLTGLSNVLLVEPLAYLPFVWLMDQATIVLTDSGGIQEEAPSLGKPVLVMRNTTERPEGVDAGNALLVGTNRDRITAEVLRLLGSKAARDEMSRVRNPYGDGRASVRIADALEASGACAAPRRARAAMSDVQRDIPAFMMAPPDGGAA